MKSIVSDKGIDFVKIFTFPHFQGFSRRRGDTEVGGGQNLEFGMLNFGFGSATQIISSEWIQLELERGGALAR